MQDQKSSEFSSKFSRESTTSDVLSGIDLSGKTVLVTGVSSGLGAETARAMACHGAKVITTARDIDKGQAVVDKIRLETGNETVFLEQLELGSLQSVRDCAERILSRWPEIHIVFNNAGVAHCPQAYTEEGFESQFGCNHLAHFLLIIKLMPALRKGAPSRVVATSSMCHSFSPVVFEDIHYKNRPYDADQAYGQSKVAINLFMYELNKRYQAEGIKGYSLHPGSIYTGAGRHMVSSAEEFSKAIESMGQFQKTIPQGAATQCWAATAPELEEHGGAYLEDCQLAKVNNDPAVWWGVTEYSSDPEAARQLWEVSEQMVGERFC